jgi:hypothetical protein
MDRADEKGNYYLFRLDSLTNNTLDGFYIEYCQEYIDLDINEGHVDLNNTTKQTYIGRFDYLAIAENVMDSDLLGTGKYKSDYIIEDYGQGYKEIYVNLDDMDG